jgi:hypothetical protein
MDTSVSIPTISCDQPAWMPSLPYLLCRLRSAGSMHYTSTDVSLWATELGRMNEIFLRDLFYWLLINEIWVTMFF